MSDTTRINGNQISWASVKLTINSERYSGITAIEFSDAVEKALAYGTGRHHAPRGRTVGKYVPEPMVITCWKSTSAAVQRDLNNVAGRRGLASVSVPIVLQYIEADDSTITVEAQGAALVKIEDSDEESSEGLQEKLTFSVMRYLRNGIALFDTSEEAGA